jgi:uncharacterized protein (TIGR02246 family)
MSRRLLGLLLLIALPVATSVVQAQSMSQSGGGKAAAQRGIDDAWARAAEGLKKGDAAAIAALYTNDAIVIGPDAPTSSGRASIEKDMHTMFASSKFLDVSHQSTALDVSGDIAVDTGVYTMTVQEQGKPP